jgi:hypothetical protein
VNAPGRDPASENKKTPLGNAPAGLMESGCQNLGGDQKLYFTPKTAPRSPKNLPSKELL